MESIIKDLTMGITGLTWQMVVMWCIGLTLMYLAVVKDYEPLLLMPMGFGAILTNIPFSSAVGPEGPLTTLLHAGISNELFPVLIFVAVGAMCDFTPLLKMPFMMVFGAAAQFGIFATIVLAALLGFPINLAAAIGIIGAADGPTTIFVANKFAKELLGPLSVAAYSYMSLVPIIQPPVIRALTTKKEREIQMEQLRNVSKLEKICFPIVVSIFCILLLPSVAPLIGMLMLGNLFKESGVVERLSDTVQNALINIVTIFLGITVGATAVGSKFLTPKTIEIIILGLIAFMFSTVGGLLIGKFFCWVTKGKINPLIGSAGVSAVPMAARVSQIEGQKANPRNYLLMHAMGPNVAGVIGSAVAAGILLSLFG
jgi:oxaloacetate decarboxylase beta subunit